LDLSKAKKVQEMRLARYLADERENYGVLTSDKIACLPRLAKRLGMQLPDLIRDFIASGMAGEDAERQLSEATKEDIESVSRPINEVTLLSPIDSPPKIVCLGLNYRDHAAEQNAAIPDEPIIFIKPHTTIIGPDENIIKPSFVKKLDYEAELAIIIERKAKNVSVSEAGSHIFGYTILNDVSARDLQFKDKQWTRGKSIDTFAPIGPSITTENQLQDTSDLFIRTWVNNELRQNSTTKNMVFDVYEIVHHLSRIMTLEPCDIIATGTPAGVGFALKPQPKFLQPGDIVTIEIEKIGILENIVTEET
jgi:2-keto-4-pentenoate hydratase/2-oxohepta-3-ene-1,7-dioic acid hydratase in catechol pathway